MLKTLSELPLTQLLLLLLTLLTRHCYTASVEYVDGSSDADEFARWIASRIARERNIQVLPRRPFKFKSESA